jgi:hypothetical protein
MEPNRPRAGLLYYQIASVLLLLVCVGFGISALYAAVRLSIPTVTVNDWAWREVETLDSFIETRYAERDGKYYATREPMPAREASPESTMFSARTREEVEERWRSEKARVLSGERRQGAQQLLLSAIALAIGLPLYLWHHREVRRGRAGD